MQKVMNKLLVMLYLQNDFLGPHRRHFWIVTSVFLQYWWTGLWLVYLAQHSATGRPTKALAQTVKKPQGREDADSGGPGEDHIDASYHAQANWEEPAGTDLVWKHAADELTDSVGQRLTASDHSWAKEG